MPYTGDVTGAAPGGIEDILLDVNVQLLANSVLALTPILMDFWKNRYLFVVVNGQYIGPSNHWIGDEDEQILIPLPPGTTVGSVYVGDAGLWPTFDPTVYVPVERAIAAEATVANQILFSWSSSYQVSPVEGDTQFSITSVTGAERAVNVSVLPGQNQRGSLTYSITTVGTTHIVRFWDDGTLVAEGSRVGNGSVTCAQINGSGLQVVGTLTYTADLKPGTSLVSIRWPASYQIHYSTSPLSFPRTPELTQTDDGKDDYSVLSLALSNGTYNWTVLPVDDEGIVQSTGIPTPTPLVVNAAPNSPTITSVTGTAAALTVHWSGGTVGSTYTVYASLVNQPTNLGNFTLPAPIVTGVNATSQALAAVTGYASTSNQAFVTALETAFDAQAAAMGTAFSAGESGFLAVLQASETTLLAAAEYYLEQIQYDGSGQLEALRQDFDTAILLETFLLTLGLDASDWSNRMGQGFSRLLGSMGELLNHNAGRYTLPNGAIVGGAPGSLSLGTGGNAIDGTAGETIPTIATSLEDLAQPITKTGHVRIIVRATLAGVQEHGDAQYTVELDNSGNLVLPRPPSPTIKSAVASKSGSTLTVTADLTVLTDNASAIPDTAQLYVTAPGAINPASPQATIALPTAILGVQEKTISFVVGSSGWYECAVSCSASGSLSALSDSVFVYVDTTWTQSVANISAQVCGRRGNSNGVQGS